MLCCHGPRSESRDSSRLHFHRSTCSSLWNVNPDWHHCWWLFCLTLEGSAWKNSLSLYFHGSCRPFPVIIPCPAGCLSQWELCLLTQHMEKPRGSSGSGRAAWVRAREVLRCFHHDPRPVGGSDRTQHHQFGVGGSLPRLWSHVEKGKTDNPWQRKQLEHSWTSVGWGETFPARRGRPRV